MTIGGEIRKEAYRDTSSFYQSEAAVGLISENLVRFAVRWCGKSVLDLGCSTGNYMIRLNSLGFRCTGADVNPGYVEAAKKRGLEVVHVTGNLPFPDKSFDSVLMFEVAEHIPDLEPLLREVRRVARKNILITVPNCEGYDELKKSGLTFEHFLEADHKNFFTPETLRRYLSDLFEDFEIRAGDPVNPASLASPFLVRIFLKAYAKVGLIRPKYFTRLYTVVHLS